MTATPPRPKEVEDLIDALRRCKYGRSHPLLKPEPLYVINNAGVRLAEKIESGDIICLTAEEYLALLEGATQ
mgnify:CR=1 FL=1